MYENFLKWIKKIDLVLVLIIVILILLLHTFLTPKYQEWLYHPLPPHTLKNLSGEEIQLTTQFPNQDYLILFFSNKSPTSSLQLIEISKLAQEFSDQLEIILIHLGSFNGQLPIELNQNLHLFYDPNADFAKKMNICTVPTLILLTNEQLEIIRHQEFVTLDQLYKKGV